MNIIASVKEFRVKDLKFNLSFNHGNSLTWKIEELIKRMQYK